MDKKRRTKYQIAVYGVVGALGVVLVLISLVFRWPDVWQSIWINLGTGLVGVVVLFFLVDRFFLSDEWSMADRIDQLIQRIELSDRPSAEAFFVKPPDLSQYFRNAIEVDLCGVTLTSTLNRYFGVIRERLLAGATVRVLLANPDSLALEMSAQRSEAPDDVDYYAKRLASAFKYIGYLFKASPDDWQDGHEAQPRGQLTVRLQSYAPSFGLQRFKASGGDEVIVVELYPHHRGFTSPPTFVLKPERDKSWFTYFGRQFEQMWGSGTPWDAQAESEEITHFLQRPIGHARASSFLFTQRYLPNHLLEGASTIYLSGFTLARATREYLRILERCLARGGDVRVMILAATDALLDECVKRSEGQSTPMHWRKRLESTESLVNLIAKTSDATGRLALGHLPYLPSYGLVMVDPDTDHGVIVVELYHHRSSEDNPTFELRPARDREWYDFFRRQFDLMWESCRLEDLPRPEDGDEIKPGASVLAS